MDLSTQSQDLCVVPDEITTLVREMCNQELVESKLGSEEWLKIERLESELANLPQQEMPLNHILTDGQYTRSIFMPTGTLLTSRIHLYEHPFIISAGSVSVWSDEFGWQLLNAPHIGVTKPGTRRILYIHQDCIWTTIHLNPNNETDPDKIVKMVTYTGGKFKEIGGAAK